MGQGKSSYQANRHSHCCKPQALPDDQLEHVAALGAERHAYPQLTRALGYRIAHHTVDADGGQQQRHGGKKAKQQHAETLSGDGFKDHILHGTNIGDRLIFIDFPNRLSYGGRQAARLDLSADDQVGWQKEARRLGDCQAMEAQLLTEGTSPLESLLVVILPFTLGILASVNEISISSARLVFALMSFSILLITSIRKLTMPEIYSCRSASIGSTFVARRAGMKQAKRAIPVKTKATVKKVNSSVVLTP